MNLYKLKLERPSFRYAAGRRRRRHQDDAGIAQTDGAAPLDFRPNVFSRLADIRYAAHTRNWRRRALTRATTWRQAGTLGKRAVSDLNVEIDRLVDGPDVATSTPVQLRLELVQF